MAILPDRILSPNQINSFISQCNDCQRRIIGEVLFEIPQAELPGVGLLIDLELKILERSIASAFAPIFIGKKIIEDARRSPARFLRIVREGIESIRQLFTDPLQFVLDEGINKVLENFPLPIRIILTSSFLSLDLENLRNLLNSPSVLPGSENISFDYEVVFNSTLLPAAGEVTTPSQSLNNATLFRVSNTPKSGQTLPPLGEVNAGDVFTIFTSENVATYRVSSKSDKSSYFELYVQKISSSSNTNPDDNKFFVNGFKNGISLSQNSLLRRFRNENGFIILPISLFGISFLGFNRLAIEIGNIDSLSLDSPIRRVINRLEEESGLIFGEVLSDMREGIFPQIDNQKLQEGDNKEKAKKKIIEIARLLQLASSEPLFVIKILSNYIKLLVLPLKIVFGVLKGLAEKITNPVSLLRVVVQGISNPLRLICELISISVLEFIEPLLSPIISQSIPYEDAVEDPSDRTKGLKPLIASLVCGSFFRDLRNYRPNASFFQEQNRLLGDQSSALEFGPNIPYKLLAISENPLPGEIVVNSEEFSQIRVLKVSTTTDTVEDSTSFLANVNPGENIRLATDGSISVFRVNSSFFRIDPNGNFYELLVQPVDISSNVPTIPRLGLSLQLNINNPNKEFLFIIERFLPLKLIGAWQSIKAILALVICVVARIPSLLTAIVKSLFGRDQDDSVTDENPTSSNPEDLLNSTEDVLEILYDGPDSIMSKISTPSSEREEFTAIAQELIGNSPEDTDGIEQYFYRINDSLVEKNRAPIVLRSNLPTEEALDFYWNELDVDAIGNIVKVLSVADYELRNIDPEVRSEFLSVPPVYVNVRGEIRVLYPGGFLINALRDFRIFTDLGILNDQITTEQARNLISSQILFVSRVLLPTLN